MQQRTLGQSDLQVSVVGLGANNFGGRMETAATRAVVHKALDCGVTLIDTADAYGPDGKSEAAIGEVLKARTGGEEPFGPRMGNRVGDLALTADGTIVADNTAGSIHAVGASVAGYAAKELKVKNVGVIDDRTAFGQGIAMEFKRQAQKNMEMN